MEDMTWKLTDVSLNLLKEMLFSMQISSKFIMESFFRTKTYSNGFLMEMPAKRRAYAQAGDNGFTSAERDLIFDIDITDYDDVRYCCSGANVCLDCWPLMTVAIKLIDTVLREDFGFDHILWVYSGRCGVHCWVCDRKTRRLNNEQWAAIAGYLHGNENSHTKVSLTGQALHPFLARSYTEVLKDFFEERLLWSRELFSSGEI